MNASTSREDLPRNLGQNSVNGAPHAGLISKVNRFSMIAPTDWSKQQTTEALSAWTHLLELRDRHLQPARTELFHEGTAAHDDQWLIDEGPVLLTCAHPGGESAFSLRLPSQLLDQCASAFGMAHRYTALTLTRFSLRRIDAAVLHEREVNDPDVARLVQHQLRIDLHNAAGYILELKGHSLEQRFRQLLAKFCASVPANGILN